ncbi:MAG TPA: hypothetical protein VNI84_11845 [Pyrinomonadaceae bacterium]|nr:hypothetical protein [Pyrinomonadaceae bacterium]
MKNCRRDLVSSGEVLSCFDSGDERLQTTRNFHVFDGGGEYNVARNRSKTFRRGIMRLPETRATVECVFFVTVCAFNYRAGFCIY